MRYFICLIDALVFYSDKSFNMILLHKNSMKMLTLQFDFCFSFKLWLTSVFVGRGSSMCGGLWGSKYGCCCGGQFSCMDASVSRYLDSMISSGLGAIRAETVGPARDGEVVRPSWNENFW